MIEIIPAILPATYKELQDKLGAVMGQTRSVQIDVCDGLFVPATTFPYTDAEAFEHILAEEETLPFWEEFDFEIDLMVEASKEAALRWVKAGASRIIVHVESPDDRSALEVLQPLRDTYATAVEVMLAISLDTPIEKLETLAPLASGIQVMGIATIGAQGHSLDERVFEKIRTIHAHYPEHIIAVDGGVKIDNAKALALAGATRLVVGSALFEGNVEENYLTFTSVVNS